MYHSTIMHTHVIELSVAEKIRVQAFTRDFQDYFPLSTIEFLNVERYLDKPIHRRSRSSYGKTLMLVECYGDDDILKSYIDDNDANLVFSTDKQGLFFEVDLHDMASFQKKYPNHVVIDYELRDDDYRIVYVQYI